MLFFSEGPPKGSLFPLFFLSFTFLVAASSSYDPFSAAARCPLPCDDLADHSHWGLYRDASQLDSCNQTILVDLNLYHGIDVDVDMPDPIRACTVLVDVSSRRRRQFFSPSSSNQTNATTSTQKDISVVRWNDQTGSGHDTAMDAATAALAQAIQTLENGSPTILFAQSGAVVLGVYAGAEIDKKGLGDLVQSFATHEAGHETDQTAAQLCSTDALSSEILGIFVDTTGRLAGLKAAKAALGRWNNATCVSGTGGTAGTWTDVNVPQVAKAAIAVGPSDSLAKRDSCSYTQAVAGDGCWSLADRCEITEDELLSYNDDDNLCTNLIVGQYVCCSSGTLPDFSPQPNEDGTCQTYTVESGDYCSAIAEANTMTVDDIESRNENTWGWAGCSYLLVGQVLCLSTGDPPMPAEVVNAVCGPTVPGTERPDDMDTLADLNPCPLDVCCNVWGQCGITDDFCISSPADTGAPGTATPGSNGCISSCDMNITNNDEEPSSFITLGYWEAWNGQRACLHMKAGQIDTNHYTHLHFAFGSISDTFEVGVGNLTSEFSDFLALTGVQRILSFGGWSFSTDYDTYRIFRSGVTEDQRQTFVDNVVAFVSDNDLDGVDFDWEYPGTLDIPGIPAGSEEDGTNYLAFLKLVREALPADKSVSIAAPASYWYLKGFPIAEISEVVDYIVYMTYDLHGQWDYGNSWSDEGCSEGNCLKSHANKTETELALAMITHAGVQANKILVGMALYRRSFNMTTAGCYGADCTFVGPDSAATPGRCTDTAGYMSNFEIRRLLAKAADSLQSSDDGRDILMYDSVQWISRLSQESYNDRLSWVKGLNFAGTCDWAIDSDEAGEGDHGFGPVYISPDIYSDDNPVVQCYPPCTLILPPMVLPSPTTITLDPITVTYKDTWSTITTISGAAIRKSVGSTTSTVITLPPITTQTIPVSNVVWDPTASSSSTDAAAILWLAISIIPPPVTITQTQTRSSGSPVVWTFSPGPYPTPPTDSSWPPPPPPPSGFPSTVTVSSGTPGPTCQAGQTCGWPCVVNCASIGGGSISGPGCTICGCIGHFCMAGSCVGAGCADIDYYSGDRDEDTT